MEQEPDAPGPSTTAVPPKSGAHFSTGALRVLKNWLATHEHHPYPRSKDILSLQHQTGLTKVQITTWFSNARRRTKTRIPIRPTSPGVPKPRKIPIPPASAPTEEMNPLQRWRNSPPEDEPADPSAILDAVSRSPTSERPHAVAGPAMPMPMPVPQPSVWGEWSSASSTGASSLGRGSGGSSSSHMSASSRGSAHSMGRWSRHRRRRRDRGPQNANANTNAKTNADANARGRAKLSELPRKFQCTFCTESFSRKLTWQRHEKSMHLTLERWECSPEGPSTQGTDGSLLCVYCGMAEPDENHPKTHSYEKCREQLPEKRLFLRKDHLLQHLRVMHDAKLESSAVDAWKITALNVRSRCGFCDLVMTSWAERTDHIAEHFQAGKTMAEWHGDWGFDEDVAEMVDNSIPPYLNEFERTSPWPFTTKRGPPATPPNAFELIKLELEQFSSDFLDANSYPPAQEDLQYESCCIILGADVISSSSVPESATEPSSWLRDLLLSSTEVLQRARVRPLSSVLKGRVTELRINGKADIFDGCSLEGQLLQFARSFQMPVSQVSVSDLQRGACRIVEQFDSQSKQPSASFVGFLVGLINASMLWLLPFQQRAGLLASTDDAGPDFSLADMPEVEVDDTYTTAVAPWSTAYGMSTEHPTIDNGLRAQNSSVDVHRSSPLPFPFLSTDTYYWGLRRGLARYVAMTISPGNPQGHIPTDEELQYQARLIMFESEDPWNQTPADNPEWLLLFKRDNGLVPE